MFIPSGTKPPSDGFRVVAVDKGMYSVENAYEGAFEYFEDRPIPLAPDNPAGNHDSPEKKAGQK